MKKIIIFTITMFLFFACMFTVESAYLDNLIMRLPMNATSQTNDVVGSYNWTNSGVDFTSGVGHFELDDSDYIINDDYTVLLGSSNDYTICVKVAFESLASAQKIWGERSIVANYEGIMFSMVNDGGYKFRAEFGTSAPYGYAYGTAKAVDTDYAACWMYDDSESNISMYLDGAYIDSYVRNLVDNNHANKVTLGASIGGVDSWLDGNLSEVCVWERILTEAETGEYLASGCVGAAPPPPVSTGLRNVTFTAKDNYDASAISTFNITVNGGGTNGTTGSSIVLELNITSFFNITFHSPLYIINDSYEDVNLSSDLEGWLHQAELYLDAEDYLQGYTINTFNTTVGSSINITGSGLTRHYLKADNYTIIGNSSGYYNITALEVEATALSNQTETIKFYKVLNVSATSVTGVPILNFTINITGVDIGDSRLNTTTGGIIEYLLSNQTYNLSIINVTGYAEYNDNQLILINSTDAYSNINFVLYTTNSFDISFIDEATSIKINGTQILLDLISDLYAANYSTTNGSLYVDLLTPTTYTFRYYGVGYQPRLSTYTLVNNTYNQITLYLLTGGANVTIYVYDTSRYPVENATINIFRYSTVNNSYLQINTINTDFEGKAVSNLQLSSEFYRFYIYSGGVLKLSTSPAYVTGTEIIFTITLEDDILDNYFTAINDYTYSLTFNPTTKNFKYYYDTNNEASQGCLYIYKVTAIAETLHNSTCTGTSSGTILLAGQNVSGTSYLAKAYVTVDTQDYLLNVLSWEWIESSFTTTNKELGIFIVIMLTLVFAFIGLWSLPVAFILAPLPLLIGSAMQFINIPIGTAFAIEIMCVVLAGLISRS